MIQIQLTESRVPDIRPVADVVDVLHQIRTVEKVALPGMIIKMVYFSLGINRVKCVIGLRKQGRRRGLSPDPGIVSYQCLLIGAIQPPCCKDTSVPFVSTLDYVMSIYNCLSYQGGSETARLDKSRHILFCNPIGHEQDRPCARLLGQHLPC